MSMRVSGFASGMDIDAMVLKMMQAKREPLNKLNQQKTRLEWQQEQYRDINIKLIDFRSNKLSNYGMTGSISAKQINVSGNSTAVTAKANSNAVAGTMNIEVKDLATAATIKSGDAGIGQVDMSMTLADLKAAGKITYDDEGGGDVTITVNGTNLIFNDQTSTLASVVATINSNSSVKANVFIDGATGKMSITNKQTGADNSLSFSGSLLANFNLVLPDDSIADAGGGTASGTDALVVINGIETTRSSNIFTENGVEITLNSKSNGTSTTLNIVSNTDKIVDTIKSFLKDYNELFDAVNSKLGEEKYRKFAPLTDDQKKEMKEDEIKMWEEKAKSGLLRNDTALSSMISGIRLASVTSVDVGGTEINLNSLGIRTGEWSDKGKLMLADESKLRAAIEANPDQVLNFFTQKTTETDAALKGSPTNPDSGLFNRISSAVMTAIEGMAEKAGTSKYSTDSKATFMPNSLMGVQLRELGMRISNESARMIRLENSYYKKFTAMESAMNRYSSQSSSLFGATQ